MSIKNIIKRLIPQKVKNKIRLMLSKAKLSNKKDEIVFVLKNYYKFHYYNTSKSYSKQIEKAYSRIKPKESYGFVYFIDDHVLFDGINGFSNGTIDYSLMLDYSLLELKELTASKEMIEMYESIISIAQRIYKKTGCEYFQSIIDKKCGSLKEALQRILFVNQLLWQTGHVLVGLGRLDLLLSRFIQSENDDYIFDLLTSFLRVLHVDYRFKSASLFGDTGQIIILGGALDDGSYFANKLTYMFIRAIKELHIPDPKVLLRVSKKTPRELLSLSLECIETGIGCPLFANDEVIIPILHSFGYELSDSYNYVTSACWEPYPASVSTESNNTLSFNFLVPFTKTIYSDSINNAMSFLEVVSVVEDAIVTYANEIKTKLEKFKYGHDVLSSCFVLDCLKTNKTLDSNCAKYHNLGITTVGLSNVVDSLIAIRHIIFVDRKFSLLDFLKLIKEGKRDNSLNSYIELLPKFGNDDDEVIELTNKLLNVVKGCFTNAYPDGRKIKLGLSSPNYIADMRDIPPTPDGRANGSPANVHISCRTPCAYTELVSFASQLDYSKNAFNGNVVDFIVAPSFIRNNSEKFIDFLESSIIQGFFEMQMNVVDSSILIAAKRDPSLYPNLIVRVWGFSAYFNDLPDDYKDVLIERALQSENAYK